MKVRMFDLLVLYGNSNCNKSYKCIDGMDLNVDPVNGISFHILGHTFVNSCTS